MEKVKTLREDVNLKARTEKQRRVIELARREPNLTHEQIADNTSVSPSYVSTIHSDYLVETIRPESISLDDIDKDIYEILVAGIKMAENVTQVKRKYDLNLSQGCSKEVDVAVWLEQAGHQFLAAIECKWHGDPVEQETVSGVIRNVQNSVADKGVVISREGFQSGAIAQARESNTELYILRELRQGDLDGRAAKVHGTATMSPITGQITHLAVTPADREPPEEPEPFEVDNPELFTHARRAANETIWDMARRETSRNGVGTHRVEIDNRLMLIDGEFHELHFMDIDVEAEGTFTEEFYLNAYEDYDLYMENALEPDDIELYTIEEVVANFFEDSE